MTPAPQPTPEDRAALGDCLRLGLLFSAAIVAYYFYAVAPGRGIPRDGSSLVVGRDFLNFWMYGKAAGTEEPGRWYDVLAYQRALAELLGPGYPGQNWSYPPSVMLLAPPFAALPYLWALAAWTLIGLMIFVATLWVRFGDERLVGAALVSPAAVFCMVSGQSSLLTAAVILGAFALLDRRPLVAGLLIGCLTLKPQLGLLFPVMLIASGRWRVFAAAATTTIAIAALTAAVFGVEVWVDFVEKALPTQNLVLSDPQGIGTPFYPTVFMNLRGAGCPYPLAMAVQSAFALTAAVVVWRTFRTRPDADPLMLAALFVACSVVATPYLLSYDTLALSVFAMGLLARRGLDARARLIAKLVFWLPLMQMLLGSLAVPGPALVAPAFALALVLQLKRGSTCAPLATSPNGRSAS